MKQILPPLRTSPTNAAPTEQGRQAIALQGFKCMADLLAIHNRAVPFKGLATGPAARQGAAEPSSLEAAAVSPWPGLSLPLAQAWSKV
jgi:hypothetical protein